MRIGSELDQQSAGSVKQHSQPCEPSEEVNQADTVIVVDSGFGRNRDEVDNNRIVEGPGYHEEEVGDGNLVDLNMADDSHIDDELRDGADESYPHIPIIDAD